MNRWSGWAPVPTDYSGNGSSVADAEFVEICRGEGWGFGGLFVFGEIGKQGSAELAGDGALFELCGDISGAGEQAAGADAGFEDISEFAVGDPVVDELDDGFELVVRGEDERAGVFLDFPPLPVGMEIGGKPFQSGMFGIANDAEGVGWLPFGPCGVPEDR
jgi:hypothetical protein